MFEPGTAVWYNLPEDSMTMHKRDSDEGPPPDTADLVRREFRLFQEFLFVVWDLLTIRFRRWSVFHEIFHASCQIQFLGKNDAYCKPSVKYVFKGVLRALWSIVLLKDS